MLRIGAVHWCVPRNKSSHLMISQSYVIGTLYKYYTPCRQRPSVDLGTLKYFSAWPAEKHGSPSGFKPDPRIAAMASWMCSSHGWLRILEGIEAPESKGNKGPGILWRVAVGWVFTDATMTCNGFVKWFLHIASKNTDWHGDLVCRRESLRLVRRQGEHTDKRKRRALNSLDFSSL